MYQQGWKAQELRVLIGRQLQCPDRQQPMLRGPACSPRPEHWLLWDSPPRERAGIFLSVPRNGLSPSWPGQDIAVNCEPRCISKGPISHSEEEEKIHILRGFGSCWSDKGLHVRPLLLMASGPAPSGYAEDDSRCPLGIQPCYHCPICCSKLGTKPSGYYWLARMRSKLAGGSGIGLLQLTRSVASTFLSFSTSKRCSEHFCDAKCRDVHLSCCCLDHDCNSGWHL